MSKSNYIALRLSKFNRLFLVIILILLANIYYINSHKGTIEKEYDLLYELRSMQSLYQRINATFEGRSQYESYDDIAQNMSDFNHLLSLLDEYPIFESENESKHFPKVFKKLKDDFEESRNHVEHFNSETSLIINSVRLLHDMHQEMEHRIHDSKHIKNKEYVSDILDEITHVVALTPYNRLTEFSNLEKLIEDFKKGIEKDKQILSRTLMISKHVEVLKNGYRLLDLLKSDNENLMISNTIQQIQNMLLLNLKKRDRAERWNIYALNALIFVLLVILFFVNKKEERLHTKVYHLNLNLKKHIDELEEANKHRAELLDTFDKYIISSTTDAKGRITHASQAFSDVSGYSKEELIGQMHSIVRHPDVPKETFKQMWETIRSGKPYFGEVQNRKKDGTSYWVELLITPEYDDENTITGYSAIRHVITSKKELEALSQTLEDKVYERTKELEEMVNKVEKLSITDELTGLYNRRYYSQVIEAEIRRAQRSKMTFGYLILDVDHFKLYNDNYGHQEGDAVLIKVAQRLQKTFSRAGDFVFRIGGEEFVVIFSSENREKALQVSKQVIEDIRSLALVHEYNEDYGVVTVSAGLITSLPTDEVDEDMLYQASDKLLYRAKKSGRNQVVDSAI